uniref:EIF-2B GDP-GTP exchange factor subunit alpha n=1 Tax=Parastrongyloides trichosuri TaxID=131310 RepID=A0A0N4Z256_PARTI
MTNEDLIINSFNPREYFERTIEENKDNISTGLAVIKTLSEILKQTTATASIRSASELFIRSISLVSSESLQSDFQKLIEIFISRAYKFMARVENSRSMISKYAAPYIRNDMKILTHSYSKVIFEALKSAADQGKHFHVYVTESQPDSSGKAMYEKLKEHNISCTLILDSAVGYLMELIDIVLVGAEGVMETGGIINKIGTLGVAICAKAYKKPVCIMAESIKFVKEYPLNQTDIPNEFKYNTSTLLYKDLNNEHPLVDYTPPQYIYLLFTDLGILTPANIGEELIKLYV